MSLSAMSRRVQEVAGGPTSSIFRTYAGSNGNDTTNFTGALGFNFTVATGKTLTMTKIDAFASAGGTVPPSGVTITVQVADVTTPTTIIASATFTLSDYGTLDATNRLMSKTVSASLPAGTYVIWTHGYTTTSSYPCYASDQGSPGTAPVNDGISGVTRDASNDRYGFGTGAATNVNSGVQYGGPSFEGYTT